MITPGRNAVSETEDERTLGLVRSTWPILLIGGSFTAITVFVLAGMALHFLDVAKDANPRDWADIFGALVVVGCFGPVAILLLAFVWWVGRDRRVERRLQVEYPRQPWRHRADWASQRSEHLLTPRAFACLGLALSCNALTIGGLALFLSDPPARPGGVGPAGMLILFAGFIAGTLAGGIYALWTTRDAIRFRRVHCELVAPPFRPGDSVRCLIRWERTPSPDVPLVVSLDCTSTRATRAELLGKEVGERQIYRRSHFHARAVVGERVGASGPNSELLPIRFALPEFVPETDTQNSTTWDVTLRWDSVAGLTHTLEFEIPVFSNEHDGELSPEAEAFDRLYLSDAASGFPKGARRESLTELIASYRGRLVERPGLGWEVRLPRAATSPLFNAVLVLCVSLAFAGGGLAISGWIGAGFGALPWLVMLSMAGRQRLWCGDNRIEYQRRSFLGRRTASLEFADIRRFEHRQVDRSHEGIGVHQVTAQLHSGEHVTLLSNALSPLIASGIARQLHGRKITHQSQPVSSLAAGEFASGITTK